MEKKQKLNVSKGHIAPQSKRAASRRHSARKLTPQRRERILVAIDVLLRKMCPDLQQRIEVLRRLGKRLSDPGYVAPAPLELGDLAERLVDAKTPAEAERCGDEIVRKLSGTWEEA